MPGQVRVRYEDTIYHVVARWCRLDGNARTEADHEALEATLEKVVGRTGVAGLCLCVDGQSFQLVFMTPEPNPRRWHDLVPQTKGPTNSDTAIVMKQASNLDATDFLCRHLVVDDSWILLGEILLINCPRAICNSLIDAFSNYDPGKGKYRRARASWDTFHLGPPREGVGWRMCPIKIEDKANLQAC